MNTPTSPQIDRTFVLNWLADNDHSATLAMLRPDLESVVTGDIAADVIDLLKSLDCPMVPPPLDPSDLDGTLDLATEELGAFHVLVQALREFMSKRDSGCNVPLLLQNRLHFASSKIQFKPPAFLPPITPPNSGAMSRTSLTPSSPDAKTSASRDVFDSDEDVVEDADDSWVPLPTLETKFRFTVFAKLHSTMQAHPDDSDIINVERAFEKKTSKRLVEIFMRQLLNGDVQVSNYTLPPKDIIHVGHDKALRDKLGRWRRGFETEVQCSLAGVDNVCASMRHLSKAIMQRARRAVDEQAKNPDVEIAMLLNEDGRALKAGVRLNIINKCAVVITDTGLIDGEIFYSVRLIGGDMVSFRRPPWLPNVPKTTRFPAYCLSKACDYVLDDAMWNSRKQNSRVLLRQCIERGMNDITSTPKHGKLHPPSEASLHATQTNDADGRRRDNSAAS